MKKLTLKWSMIRGHWTSFYKGNAIICKYNKFLVNNISYNNLLDAINAIR
jgi:hypothetical protein